MTREPASCEYEVHYHVDWSKRPMVPPTQCRHPGDMACPVGLRIERQPRGNSAIVVECDICLDCGDDRTGQVSLVEGLTLAMAEMRRVFAFWQRINMLVEHRRNDLAGQLVPLWMAGPLGLTTGEINTFMRDARFRRAAEYMGARMARLSGACREAT